MDQVSAALGKLRAAEEAVPVAEEQARKLAADARARIYEARAQLAEVIVAEYQAGARVSGLAKRSEGNHETIRRILRAAGIEPARDPSLGHGSAIALLLEAVGRRHLA